MLLDFDNQEIKYLNDLFAIVNSSDYSIAELNHIRTIDRADATVNFEKLLVKYFAFENMIMDISCMAARHDVNFNVPDTLDKKYLAMIIKDTKILGRSFNSVDARETIEYIIQDLQKYGSN